MPSGTIRRHLEPTGAIWSHQRPLIMLICDPSQQKRHAQPTNSIGVSTMECLGPSGHLEPSGIIWGHLGPSGAIWRHHGGIWRHLEPSGAIWSHLQLSGAIWCHLEPSGVIWSHLGPSGIVWKHLESAAGVSCKVPHDFL